MRQPDTPLPTHKRSFTEAYVAKRVHVRVRLDVVELHVRIVCTKQMLKIGSKVREVAVSRRGSLCGTRVHLCDQIPRDGSEIMLHVRRTCALELGHQELEPFAENVTVTVV